ncbi:uncharacterized protein LOC119400155 [Rhipicephalus sanguineus]|uniref:uncharacterized protein LOC119400155 n=1 Tax=Rhipicephalus sanguineus TaxID=34632 RepID=UPI0018934032|nr:uncharacterized protein LOC119400155 [Rhipicephalus sanguineus]
MSDASGDSASAVLAAKRAARTEAQRRRRQNPEVRAAEALAQRLRRQEDCAKVRAIEAASKRRRRADPAIRAAEAEAYRRRRQKEPSVRVAETIAHRRRRRNDPAVRAAEAAAQRRRRQDPRVLAAEAEARRRRREDPAVRATEAEARRRRLAKRKGAMKTSLQPFKDSSLRSVCSVCDRPSFQDDSKLLPDECHRKTLQSAFPNADLHQFWLCSTCMQPVPKDDVSHLSTTSGKEHLPRPANLPQLNAVVDAAHNAPHTCTKCRSRDTTLRTTPRRRYSKCIGKDDILPQHAHQSSQTEHHITLAWCPRPNVSACCAEVQVDLL